MQIITENRIIAASHINRWRGWLKRPFSILDHMVIGAEMLRYVGRPDHVVKKFLVHDMHETQFMGDITTPDKARYCNSRYHRDVADFDFALGDEMGWSGDRWWLDSQVKAMDELMKRIENVEVRIGPLAEIPDPSPAEVKLFLDMETRVRQMGGSRAHFWRMVNNG